MHSTATRYRLPPTHSKVQSLFTMAIPVQYRLQCYLTADAVLALYRV